MVTIVLLANVLESHGVELESVNEPCVAMCLKFESRDSKSIPYCLIL